MDIPSWVTIGKNDFDKFLYEVGKGYVKDGRFGEDIDLMNKIFLDLD